MKKFVLGIDVGGTNVKLGIVGPKGRILFRSYLSTQQFIKYRRQLINALIDAVRELVDKSPWDIKNFLGIGIGLPGLVDPKKGVVKLLPNIPHWENVPLKKIFENRLGIPTFINNDVKLITLAEWKFGAGRGVHNLICLTLGTGVGSGLVLNDELYYGEGYVAGELGHVPLNEQGPRCNCGGYGCFERYVGNKELLLRGRKIFGPHVTLEEIYRKAWRGNKQAVGFWKDVGTRIGNGLIGAVNLLNPKLIVIGGGVSNNEKFLFDRIRKVIFRRAMSVQAREVKCVRAKLGDDAGIIGAYVFIHDILSGKK